MAKPGKILVVSQYYPPDSSTTAAYVAAIAEGLAIDNHVSFLSASPNSHVAAGVEPANAEVIEIEARIPRKDAQIRRAIAISTCGTARVRCNADAGRTRRLVFCVTTPFTLPYGVVLAARLRGAATALIDYDLYPEALEATGLVGRASLPARFIRFANLVLFRALDAIITIGHDVEPLLLAYARVEQKKVHFIPNWALLPTGFRETTTDNRFAPATVRSGKALYRHAARFPCRRQSWLNSCRLPTLDHLLSPQYCRGVDSKPALQPLGRRTGDRGRRRRTRDRLARPSR